MENIASPGVGLFCGILIIQADKIPIELIPVRFQGRLSQSFRDSMEESPFLHQLFTVFYFLQPLCPCLVVDVLVGLLGPVDFSLVGDLPLLIVLRRGNWDIVDRGSRMSPAVSFPVGVGPRIGMAGFA